jgi:hypothetical protein
VIIKGRTCASRPLGVETLLRSVGFDPRIAEAMAPEEQSLYALCRKTHSVAEIAERTGWPVGVVRVIADDLNRRGLLEILPGGTTLELLGRVKRGLQAL